MKTKNWNVDFYKNADLFSFRRNCRHALKEYLRLQVNVATRSFDDILKITIA